MSALEQSKTETKPVVSPSVRRAALVLVSLDDAQAAELMRQMSPKEVEAITAAVEHLNEIDPEEQARALREFQAHMNSAAGKVEAKRVRKSELLPGEDPGYWPEEAIRLAFDPNRADDWALALADCDQPVLEHVLGSLGREDRRLIIRADSLRGPWRPEEPHLARMRIKSSI